MNLDVLVAEAPRDRWKDLVEVLHEATIVQSDGDLRESVQSRAPLAWVVSFLMLQGAMLVFRADDHFGKHLYPLVYLIKLIFCQQLLDGGLELLASELPLLDRPANRKNDKDYMRLLKILPVSEILQGSVIYARQLIHDKEMLLSSRNMY